MSWGRFSNWGGGKSAWGGRSACQSKSYHDGGVRGGGFDRWYSDKLSNHYGARGGRKHWQREDNDRHSDAGGTGGTGGTNDRGDHHGQGGKKKWWNDRKDDDQNGSGTGGSGTGGSGTGGSGTDGCGTGGGRGGHGRWGKKKWWQDRDRDEDGTGTGGTDGSGTGTDGTGTAGTAGTGTGGTDTGGTGTDGTGTGGTGDTGGGTSGSDGKTTVSFEIGGNGTASVTVEVTQTPQGQLFVNLQPSSFDSDPADIDGVFFNLTDDDVVPEVNFFPDENALPVTGHAAEANAVNTLDDGATVPENHDAMVQFGQAPDSTEGTVNNANFTLWSDAGLTLDDIDLTSVSLVVTNPDGSQEVLTGGYDPAAAASDSSSYANGGVSDAGLEGWYAANTDTGSGTGASSGTEAEADTAPLSADEVVALMNQPVPDPAEQCTDEDAMENDCLV